MRTLINRRHFWLGGLLCASLSGCVATNPVTGKTEVVLMPLAQQIAVGERHFGPAQQQQGGPYGLDPNLTAYVSAIGQRLAAVSDQPNLPYEFVVLNDSTPNAWALPGGKIAINRGLIMLLDDEAQLAAVLGHEIVHAAAGHSAAQMSRQTFLGLGSNILGALTQNSQYGNLVTMGSQVGSAALSARYGRHDELESDQYGMIYMERAGYDPQAAVELHEKLLALKNGQEGDALSNLFATHPPSSERMARNQAYAQGKTGKRNVDAFFNATRQLTKDKAAYELHSQAITAASQKQFETAKRLSEQAISRQPREGLFHLTLGQLHLMEKNTSLAYKNLSRAAELNPDYFLPSLMAGVAAKDLRQWQEADRYLAASLRLLPTAQGYYYAGEVALNQGDRLRARTHFSQAAQDQGDIGRAAQEQLARMGAGY
jgi:beta-barrel assembly-enhancing protease